MLKAPLDLSKARILLSNDDGIHAPGLEVLEKIARTLSDDVWVVAPETEQSGASHSLTLHRPLRMRQMGENRFAVDGTPTDCVLLAINHILKDRKPDLVHVCPQGAARFAIWLVAELSARFDGITPATPDAWLGGDWTADERYDTPVGACAALATPTG